MKRSSIVLTATRIVPIAIAALSLSLAACSTTSTTDTEEPDTTSKSTGSEFSQGDTPEPVKPAPRDIQADLGTVYFDFNKAEVRDDMRDVLRKNAAVLREANTVIIVEGYTDDRGSEEYNLALGERRAESVRRYLSALGVPNTDMKILSYGEAKPAVRGNDEAAWRWNRRAEFRQAE